MIFTPHLVKVLKLSQMHRCSRQPTKQKAGMFMEMSCFMFGPDQLVPAVFLCFSAADSEYLFMIDAGANKLTQCSHE